MAGLLGEHQAFRVNFALSGVLEMLPPEHRAVTARALSVVTNPAWVTAREASRLVFEKAGLLKAEEVIIDHARLGLMSARAVLAQETKYDTRTRTSSVTWDRREWDVPVWFWRDFVGAEGHRHDWERGRFEGPGVGPRGYCTMALDAVHFLTESLQVLLPAQDRSSLGEPEPKKQGKGGGQPPRAFWDEMLCDIWALIYQGTFTPKIQKDVEVAMLTWAERKGEKLSEATARPKAKLLFERYKNEAENFLAEE